MKNVAVIAGGCSGEHEISILSGKEIFKHIDKEKYNVYFIVIERSRWIYADNEGVEHELDKNDFSLNIAGKKIFFDVVYNVIHGKPGEDGEIQGYFDILGIPYTGCNMYVAGLTFHKYFCKKIVENLGVPVSDGVFLTSGDYDIDSIVNRVGLPCFVKPNKNGSSVGISKIYKKEDLNRAIELAFKCDDEVLVERFVRGRELSCGVFKDKSTLVVLPITEIVPKNDFFDYEAKYTEGKSDEITPANIDAGIAERIAEYAKVIYNGLHCEGCVRIDFIADTQNVTFLEVNSNPGMSERSIVPQQLRHHGVDMKYFVNSQIEYAINKKINS